MLFDRRLFPLRSISSPTSTSVDIDGLVQLWCQPTSELRVCQIVYTKLHTFARKQPSCCVSTTILAEEMNILSRNLQRKNLSNWFMDTKMRKTTEEYSEQRERVNWWEPQKNHVG